ncbi:helix-turn-helix transcriptional regulator [Sediminibacillus massiliensis]|uniref:helix-turn-helix transcriptional regulator n=1 Tax=Sediminibacillus massiliensis TaxID=1926277 RepID=UPI00098882F7|nr:helix-turn-helix domain-containing protein [Sediminibacillus massiliensis]
MKTRLINKLPPFLRISGNYRKNLVIFLLIASFPGIIFSFLLYFVSKTQMESELQTIHQNHLYNTIDSIKGQFSDLELLMANWASQANMQDYRDLDRTMDYETIRNIFDTLVFLEGYNPLIGRAELFLSEPEPIVYTKHGYTLLENEKEIENYRRLLSNDQKMFWDQSYTSIEEWYRDNYAPLVMVHNLDNNLFEPFGSLIVFLDKEKLENILQSPYEDGSVFLLRGNDEWLFGKQDQTSPTPVQQAIMEEINDRPDNPEPFVFRYDNIKYTVTYDYFSRLGENWYYVSLAPMTTITAPVVFISKLFLYLSLFVFVFAIILSLFASRKLYAPIEKLTRSINGSSLSSRNEFELIEMELDNLSTESEELQTRLQKQLPHLREGFLLQLVQGYLYSYREEDLIEHMEQFGSNNESKQYVIAFVQLFGFTKLTERFSEGDEGLVTFSAVNITEELIHSSKLEADVINFHDLSLGILFSFPEEQPVDEIDDLIVGFSEELTEYINDICKMDVSIGISKKARSLKSVHRIFEETKASLSFRNLQESNQIIEMDKMDILLNSHDSFEYPFDLEKELTNAIRLRNKEEATRLLNEFFSPLAEKNVSEAMMKQASLKLLGSIFHIILQSGLVESFMKEGSNLYEELYRLKDTDEIIHWFEQKAIIPIIEELSQKQDQRLRLIVEKVIHMLEEEYMTDISLDYCADEVNLNPSVLSKVFKDFSGWNFIDYLTHIRLTKAKELLLETDTKIKDISESVGYNHSYFNRIFKKHEGITPSEYRKVNRKIS